MNDRFKFRIFVKNEPNPKYNRMFKVHSLHLGTNKAIISSQHGNVSIKLDSSKILMQCTGLKDKNGKLIYEGDIVKMPFVEPILNYMPSEENTEFAKIEEFKGCFTILYLDNSQRAYLYQWNNKIEVIGNIYENPELFEEGRE